MTVKKTGSYFGNKGILNPTANGQLLVSNTSSPEQASWLSTGSPVLLAETSSTSGTTNSFSGMTNPQMIDGTTSITFSSIPQSFKDLKLTFSQMAHNTNNSTGYRITIAVNGDTTTNRYYSRSGFQATSGAQWNSDNTERWYYGYVYRPENVTWVGNGEITIPLYSQTMPYNTRGAYGSWFHMTQMTMPAMYGFQYYNSSSAALPITSLVIRMESDPGFRAHSRIALLGL